MASELDIKTYARRDSPVEAVQLTEENWAAAASWLDTNLGGVTAIEGEVEPRVRCPGVGDWGVKPLDAGREIVSDTWFRLLYVADTRPPAFAELLAAFRDLITDLRFRIRDDAGPLYSGDVMEYATSHERKTIRRAEEVYAKLASGQGVGGVNSVGGLSNVRGAAAAWQRRA